MRVNFCETGRTCLKLEQGDLVGWLVEEGGEM